MQLTTDSCIEKDEKGPRTLVQAHFLLFSGIFYKISLIFGQKNEKFLKAHF